MTCTPIKIGETRAIVCTPRRWRRRCACGAWAELLCDHPNARGRGTCDRAICRRCATEIGRDRHHCPDHRRAPVQGVLGL